MIRAVTLGVLVTVGCQATPPPATKPAAPHASAVSRAAPAAPPEASTDTPQSIPAPPSTAAAAAPPPHAALPPPLPRGTVVLHIGDSMADALGKPLDEELSKRGIKGYLEAKEATYIPDWAGFKMQLPQLLVRRNPDLVLITLGGNELAMPDPSERVAAIERLVAAVGERPCLWIAAPLWPGLHSTGLLEVIRSHCAPCRFVDTNALIADLERLGDRVHPTIPERRRWARFMIRWMLHNRDPSGPLPWSFKAKLAPPPPGSQRWLEQR